MTGTPRVRRERDQTAGSGSAASPGQQPFAPAEPLFGAELATAVEKQQQTRPVKQKRQQQVLHPGVEQPETITARHQRHHPHQAAALPTFATGRPVEQEEADEQVGHQIMEAEMSSRLVYPCQAATPAAGSPAPVRLVSQSEAMGVPLRFSR